MKKDYSLLLLIIIVIIAALASCKSKPHYSTLDQYIETTIKADSANKAAAESAKMFIDSLNNKRK